MENVKYDALFVLLPAVYWTHSWITLFLLTRSVFLFVAYSVTLTNTPYSGERNGSEQWTEKKVLFVSLPWDKDLRLFGLSAGTRNGELPKTGRKRQPLSQLARLYDDAAYTCDGSWLLFCVLNSLSSMRTGVNLVPQAACNRNNWKSKIDSFFFPQYRQMWSNNLKQTHEHDIADRLLGVSFHLKLEALSLREVPRIVSGWLIYLWQLVCPHNIWGLTL